MLNRDALNHTEIKAAATTTMAIIDRLQDYPAELQIIAVAASFKLLAERLNIDPQDVMTVVGNIMTAADGRRVEFDAVAAYLEGEL